MRRAISTALLLMIITLCFTGISNADSSSPDKIMPPVTVKIPVQHVIKGIKNKNVKKDFILTAEDLTNPMPDGAASGCKKITSAGNGSVEFGTITFDYPGEYYYTVTRSDDSTAYRILVAAYNDGTSDVIIWDESDGGKVEKAIFKDSFISSPKTGDETSIMDLFAIAAGGIVSLFIFFAIILKRRKERRYMGITRSIIAASCIAVVMLTIPVFAEDISDDQGDIQQEITAESEMSGEIPENEELQEITDDTADTDDAQNDDDSDEESEIRVDQECTDEPAEDTELLTDEPETISGQDMDEDIDLGGYDGSPSYSAVFEGVWDEEAGETTWEERP